jgi:hypothetical protein
MLLCVVSDVTIRFQALDGVPLLFNVELQPIQSVLKFRGSFTHDAASCSAGTGSLDFCVCSLQEGTASWYSYEELAHCQVSSSRHSHFISRCHRGAVDEDILAIARQANEAAL